MPKLYTMPVTYTCATLKHVNTCRDKNFTYIKYTLFQIFHTNVHGNCVHARIILHSRLLVGPFFLSEIPMPIFPNNIWIAFYYLYCLSYKSLNISFSNTSFLLYLLFYNINNIKNLRSVDFTNQKVNDNYKYWNLNLMLYMLMRVKFVQTLYTLNVQNILKF